MVIGSKRAFCLLSKVLCSLPFLSFSVAWSETTFFLSELHPDCCV